MKRLAILLLALLFCGCVNLQPSQDGHPQATDKNNVTGESGGVTADSNAAGGNAVAEKRKYLTPQEFYDAMSITGDAERGDTVSLSREETAKLVSDFERVEPYLNFSIPLGYAATTQVLYDCDYKDPKLGITISHYFGGAAYDHITSYYQPEEVNRLFFSWKTPNAELVEALPRYREIGQELIASEAAGNVTISHNHYIGGNQDPVPFYTPGMQITVERVSFAKNGYEYVIVSEASEDYAPFLAFVETCAANNGNMTSDYFYETLAEQII